MRRPTFKVCQYLHRGKRMWRIRIPARFSATGKVSDLYYHTKADAERDAVALREKYASGDLLRNDILSPAVVRDARDALAMLAAAGSTMSLTAAVKLALEHQAAIGRGLPVSELLERYAAEVSAARQWSAKHRSTWRNYSTRFAAAFGTRNIATITAPELREWYAATYGQSATYYNSALAVIAPAFSWAVKQELIDRNPFELIERRKVAAADGVDVFTPAEARRLLAACRDHTANTPVHPMWDGSTVPAIYRLDCTDARLPFAILLFAGIRPEELTKLTWEDIRTEQNGTEYIHVRPSVAKTRQVRLVRVRPTLAAFLATIPQSARTGALVPKNWKRKAAIVRKAAGLQNRHDTARHSFASYALAQDGSLDNLRADLGHTRGSDMLYKHYRAATTAETAAEYWSIRPE